MQELINILLESTMVINIILSTIIIFVERRDPRIVWAWILVLNFIPVIGFVLYLMIGMDYYKEKMFRTNKIDSYLKHVALRQERILGASKRVFKSSEINAFKDIMRYNLEMSNAVITDNNYVEIFTDGRHKFEMLRRDIENASRYIHLQYYIIKDDQVWNSLERALIKKAKEGIEVRILYDGMGTRGKIKKRLKKLENHGIKIGEFFPPLLGRFHLRVNYRNHRKIVVIDGAISYIGGFNIGKEYIGEKVKFGNWRDTHLRVEGAAVTSLAILFGNDWSYATSQDLFQHDFVFQVPSYGKVGEVPVQIISSGPESQFQQIRDTYLMMINKAQKNIYIQTPYFVPDEAILTALKIAAISGVDVRIMIPNMPDHPIVYWATYSYIGELIEVGVQCYTYEKGFLHAKVMTIDGIISSCGTANMDIRSFKLNFEVNAIVYDKVKTQEMEEQICLDINDSRIITLENYQRRSLKIKIKEGFARLFAPVL